VPDEQEVAHAEAVRQMYELHRDVGRKALEKALDAIDQMDASQIPIAVAVQLLKFGADLERRAVLASNPTVKTTRSPSSLAPRRRLIGVYRCNLHAGPRNVPPGRPTVPPTGRSHRCSAGTSSTGNSNPPTSPVNTIRRQVDRGSAPSACPSPPDGKTTWVLVRIARQMLPRRQTVAYTAQDRSLARTKWMEHVELLMDTPFANRVERVDRQQNREVMTMKNGSRYMPVTPTSKKAARSLSLDLAVIDEAYAHDSMGVVEAINRRSSPGRWRRW